MTVKKGFGGKTGNSKKQEKRIKGQTLHKQSIDFYPLSPNDRLDKERDASRDYSTYEAHLKKVFLHPEMHNIAITGSLGIGKSSIIRTFDRRRNLLRLHNKHFLYISLTNFRCDTSTDGHPQAAPSTTGSHPQTSDAGKEEFPSERKCPEGKNQGADLKRDLEKLERDLLCQILYVCDDVRKVSGVTYRLIPSPKSWLSWHIPIFLFVLLAASIFTAAYSSELYAWVAPFLSLQTTTWCSSNAHFLKACPYGLILLCLIFFSWKLAMWLSHGAHLSKLTLESSSKAPGVDKIGLDIQSAEESSYLDRHGFDLVYVLERMASRFDHTIVFEDMDRLDNSVRKAILSDLREINILINSRLSHRKRCFLRRIGRVFPHLERLWIVGWLFRNPSIRFFYVADDVVFAPEECSKFFDYVLPVIPSISGESLTDRLARIYLPSVGIELDEQSPERIFRPSVIFACAVPELNDFRTIRTILNEYHIFEEVERQRGLIRTQQDKVMLFAYVVYKNLCSEDYYRICMGRSVVFPPWHRQGENDLTEIKSPLVQDWTRKGLLPWECIVFAGYSLTWLAENYEAVLLSQDQQKKWKLLLTCANGRSWQRELCADILQQMPEEKFKQAIKGVQLTLAAYLLQCLSVISEESKDEGSRFEEKLTEILKRSTQRCKFSEENAVAMLDTLVPQIFGTLSSGSQLIILRYLLIHSYELNKADKWLFIENMNIQAAIDVWRLLLMLEADELAVLLGSQRTVALKWMSTSSVLNAIHAVGTESKMLDIVRMIVPPGKQLPAEIGEMEFEFIPGEKKSMQNWLDEALQGAPTTS